MSSLFGINFILALLHLMIMGVIASFSWVHAASIFRVAVCRLVGCCACTVFCFEIEWGTAWGWRLVWASRNRGLGKLC
jgi:hypothetical protein